MTFEFSHITSDWLWMRNLAYVCALRCGFYCVISTFQFHLFLCRFLVVCVWVVFFSFCGANLFITFEKTPSASPWSSPVAWQWITEERERKKKKHERFLCVCCRLLLFALLDSGMRIYIFCVNIYCCCCCIPESRKKECKIIRLEVNLNSKTFFISGRSLLISRPLSCDLRWWWARTKAYEICPKFMRMSRKTMAAMAIPTQQEHFTTGLDVGQQWMWLLFVNKAEAKSKQTCTRYLQIIQWNLQCNHASDNIQVKHGASESQNH